DGLDGTVAGVVDVVEHGGDGRRLARARLAGHDDDAVVGGGELAQHLRIDAQLVQADDVGAQVAHHQVELAPVGQADVDAPAGRVELHGEVDVGGLLEGLALLGGQGEIEDLLDVLARDEGVFLRFQGKQIPPEPDAGAFPFDQVNVGAALHLDQLHDA